MLIQPGRWANRARRQQDIESVPDRRHLDQHLPAPALRRDIVLACKQQCAKAPSQKIPTEVLWPGHQIASMDVKQFTFGDDYLHVIPILNGGDLCVFYSGAKTAQRFRRTFRRCDSFGRYGEIRFPEMPQQTHAQPFDILAQLRNGIWRRGMGAGWIGTIRAGKRIQHQRTVFHRPGKRATMVKGE
jgi:hypothetical protein